MRYGTSYGQDVLNSGQGIAARFRPTGTIVPRNHFTDTRWQKVAGLPLPAPAPAHCPLIESPP